MLGQLEQIAEIARRGPGFIPVIADDRDDERPSVAASRLGSIPVDRADLVAHGLPSCTPIHVALVLGNRNEDDALLFIARDSNRRFEQQVRFEGPIGCIDDARVNPPHLVESDVGQHGRIPRIARHGGADERCGVPRILEGEAEQAVVRA